MPVNSSTSAHATATLSIVPNQTFNLSTQDPEVEAIRLETAPPKPAAVDINTRQPVTAKDKPPTEDPEYRQLLGYISRDWIKYTGSGAPAAYNKQSGEVLSKESFIEFTAVHYGTIDMSEDPGKPKRVSAGEVWWRHNLPDKETVRKIVMEPTSKPKSEDPNGDEVFNRWHVLKKLMVPPNHTATTIDIELFLNHLMYLGDGDAEATMYFMNWLAQLYQFPESKIPVAILFYSRFGGTGKSMLVKILSKVFARELVVGLTGKDLQKNFNDAIEHKRLVVINEMARSDKADSYESFKNAISEEFVAFEAKGKGAREIRNIAHYIVTTNNTDALPLMRGDRRIAVFRCEAEPKEQEYYRQLGAWMEGEGAALLAGVLATWQFPKGWDYHAPSPQTAAARSLQEAARGDLTKLVSSLIESSTTPFDKDHGSCEDLCRQINTAHQGLMARPANLTTLGTALADLGFKVRKTRVGNKPVNLYVWRHAKLWEQASPGEREAHQIQPTTPRPFEVPALEASDDENDC